MSSERAALEIPGLDVVKAKRYSRTKLIVLLVSTAWTIARLSWFALRGRSAALRRAADGVVPNPPLGGPASLAAATALSWLSRFPIGYLGGLRRWEENKSELQSNSYCVYRLIL